MASVLVKIWSKFSSSHASFSIMIIGLDNSGKTSLLNHLLSSTSAIPKRNKQQQRHEHVDETRTDTSDEQVAYGFGDNSGQLRAASSFDSTPKACFEDNDIYLANSVMDVQSTVGYNYEQVRYKDFILTVLDFSGRSKYRCLWQEFYDSIDGIVFVIDSSDVIRFVVARDELECMLGHPYFVALGKMDTKVQKANGGGSSSGGSDMNKSMSHIKGLGLSAAATFTQKQIKINRGRLIQCPLNTTPRTEVSSSSSSADWRSSSYHKSKIQQAKQRTLAQQRQRRRTKVPILFLANKGDLPNSADTENIVRALNLNQLPSDRHPWLIQTTSVASGQGICEGLDWLVSHLVSAPG